MKLARKPVALWLAAVFVATLPAVAAIDDVPVVWRMEFVSNNEAASVVRTAEATYEVFFHSLDTAATKRLGSLDARMPLMPGVSTPETVSVFAGDDLHVFCVETGKQDTIRGSCTGMSAIRALFQPSEAPIGVVGGGRYALVRHFRRVAVSAASEYVSRVIPSERLRETLPREFFVYYLQCLSTGRKSSSHGLAREVTPPLTAHINSYIADLDENSFAIVEMYTDLDIRSSMQFQVRGLTLNSLEETFCFRFDGYRRGVRLTEDGTLLAAAQTYRPLAWHVWEIPWKGEPGERAEPRLIKTVEDITDKGASPVIPMPDCLILATHERVRLHMFESGEEISLELEADVCVAVSPDGNRLLTWHTHAAGLPIRLYDISERRFDGEQIVPLPGVY